MIRARLFAALMTVLPQHGLSRLVHRLARWRWRPWKNALIRGFIKAYHINMGEAVSTEPDSYASFNAFFTRTLAPGKRPIKTDLGTILSPVDGAVSQFGTIESGRLIQAKGRHYTLDALLGGDPSLTAAFTEGRFATLYLSPRDYHRVHMPCAGTLQRMLHVPGRLFGVSTPLVAQVPRLYARNERVISLFETDAGPLAVILVGAIGVGSIETVWAGEVTPPRGQRIRSWDMRNQAIELAAGEEMGRFNLGSSVILLLPPDANVTWHETIALEAPVRLGQPMAELADAEADSGAIPGESHDGLE